jgi:hypothetical protein
MDRLHAAVLRMSGRGVSAFSGADTPIREYDDEIHVAPFCSHLWSDSGSDCPTVDVWLGSEH